MLNRNWNTFFVKPIHKGEHEEKIKPAKASTLQGGEAQFFQLPNPLITAKLLTSTFSIERNGKKGKIYPPFSLNEKEKMTAFVKGAEYPLGGATVECYRKIPESAVTGVTLEPRISPETEMRHAVRIDGELGFPTIEIFKQLLEQITQYTYQWWLRSPESPFRGPAFLGAFIDTNSNILEDSYIQGSVNTECVWHGMVQGQHLLGSEMPLDEKKWSMCINNIQNSIPAEMGILTFIDAIAHFMAGDDKRCILDLTICFEILANKRLFADGSTMQTDNVKLLRKSRLADDDAKNILRKLIIDRDHVAHGREPYILSKEPSMMTQYFEAMGVVINNYVTSIKGKEFNELATVKLGEKHKRKSTGKTS